MKQPDRIRFSALVGFLFLCGSLDAAEKNPSRHPVQYNRDIRPILSENCYACHGPDKNKRKVDLRLDQEEGAYQALEDGKFVIVRGDSSRSELIRRITADDLEDRMPPEKSGKKLSLRQIDLLRQWIDQGAQWEGHWSFQIPERPGLPEVRNHKWPRNPIDYFILARLEKEGLKPSPEASKTQLARRVTIDLTGLPPTLEEMDALLAHDSAEAYEKLVDRLLASPQYGERMAQFWLDLARYADTNGYHIDNHRDLWKWREWVIHAFNRNVPFDQFTIEQLAGDLLPNPRLDQKIATGFNRNEMVNFEGGADPDEYLTKYQVGRVDTTATVWLGMTMACAECHDHKYDPITQKEFYQFYAFFNTIAEKGLDGQKQSPAPRLMLPSPEQKARLAQYDKEIAGIEAGRKSLLESPQADWDKRQAEWKDNFQTNIISSWERLEPLQWSALKGAALTKLEDLSLLASETNADHEVYELSLRADLQQITGLRLEALTHESLPKKAAGRGENGQFVLTTIEVRGKPLAGEGSSPALLEPPVLGEWHSLGPFKASSAKEAFNKEFISPKEIDLTKTYEDGRLRWIAQPDWDDGTVHELAGENSATYLYRKITVKQPQPILVSLGSDDGIQVWLNGRSILANEVARAAAPDQEKVHLFLRPGDNELLLKVNNEGGGHGFYFALPKEEAEDYPIQFVRAVADFNDKGFNIMAALDDQPATGWSVGETEKDQPRDRNAYFVARQPFGFSGGAELSIRMKFESAKPHSSLGRFRLAATASDGLSDFADLPDNVRAHLIVAEEQLTAAQTQELRTYYREAFIDEVKSINSVLSDQREARNKFELSIPSTMIMEEMDKPRDTFVLIRGDFRNKGEKVTPGVPKTLPSLSADAPANRLALARWLVSPNHPLVSRVTVNRFWQLYFGHGIVKTSNDFGSQGEWPTHPELLDWMATEFIRLNWDIKALQKLIVMSATYRQSSKVTPELMARDPENRLLARGPRYRMDAEMIRDTALAISGLLNREIGGTSVRPYQPAGLWEQVAFGGEFSSQKYEQSQGEDLYRRGLYTYWKRSLPYPSFVAFDAPNREICTVRRARTNTPLQALVLLNDPAYVEAARALAQRILQEGAASPAERARFAFRLATARTPAKKELQILLGIYQNQLKQFQKDKKAALDLVTAGESKPPFGLDLAELAAWTAVGNVLLNLDETITK